MINSGLLPNELLSDLQIGTIKNWYPLILDKESGGYFSNVSFDWKLLPRQDKMIVTQARHIWTLSKLSSFFDNDVFRDYAFHGFRFLKKVMWDETCGGFYQMRSREGGISDFNGYYDEKRTYGNAYGVFSLAALFGLTGDDEVLQLAQDSFSWIEEHCADKEYNGYFQFLTREGVPLDKNSGYKTKASDSAELGYKDQNSSIHLLEAYTELHKVWKFPMLSDRLKNILFLIRDIIATEEGYLTLFLERNLKPVSFRNAPEEIRIKNYGLDHVSFGHDYETAFLMLEASHTLGLENDTATLLKAKRMIDHTIEYGWDKINGGFFDEGYYFPGKDKCDIIKDTKVWWSQAEGLNALLLFSKIFPEEKKYYDLFLKQWEYIKKYLIDTEYGDWYWGSLEKEPFYRTEPKGTIWKGTYHTARALMNCIKMLAGEESGFNISGEGFGREKMRFDEFIRHWQNIANIQQSKTGKQD